jgi:hypothetical protein
LIASIPMHNTSTPDLCNLRWLGDEAGRPLPFPLGKHASQFIKDRVLLLSLKHRFIRPEGDFQKERMYRKHTLLDWLEQFLFSSLPAVEIYSMLYQTSFWDVHRVIFAVICKCLELEHHSLGSLTHLKCSNAALCSQILQWLTSIPKLHYPQPICLKGVAGVPMSTISPPG